MLKVYLAAQYARRDEMCIVAKHLQEVGVEVTSRWLAEQESLSSDMGDHSDDFYKTTAAIDLEDIDRADVLVFMAESPLVGIKRGGRHVEFGYALAKGKRIFVIGFKENVFHYIPGVEHFIGIEDVVHYIDLISHVEENCIKN
jgi:nucleoside 2-deoxyribosyltransferase